MKARFIVIAVLAFTAIVYLPGCSGRHLFGNDKINTLSKAELKMKADSLLRISNPVMGYRFTIMGDFDGDHKADTLQEHYTDSLCQNEAAKYYASIDTTFEYSDMTFLNRYFNRQSFIDWKGKKLKLKGGDLGYHYIENCGDVNDDGKDEIMLVYQWDDYSSTNTAHIFTFSNNNWNEIYATPVWEWQFPPTPSGTMIPGLFGNFEYGTTEDAADNAALEEQLKAFRFMKYYPDKSVEFTGRNAIGITDDDAAIKELEEIGDRAYLQKYFKSAVLNDSLYFSPIKNPSVYYQASEGASLQDSTSYLLPLDDGASSITTRVFIKHPQSPFKTK